MTASTRIDAAHHDDVTIIVERLGDGPPVVLVPGLGRSAADYRVVAAGLADGGFETVALRPRGTDGSTAPVGELTLHDYSADAAAVALHVGDGAAVHVVGHMAGQRVARCLAVDRPELVRSLTLLAAGGLHPPEPGTSEALATLLDAHAPVDARREALSHAFFAPGNDPTPWLDGWWPEAGTGQAIATARTPITEWWLPPAGLPLLVVQGLEDRIAIPANGRDLVAAHPGARLVELEGAGHALLAERPEAILDALLEFLCALRS